MRILLPLALVLVSRVSAYADNEFPPEMRGVWGDKQACCVLTHSLPAEIPDGEHWLKITATDILGTTQGRILRKVTPRATEVERAKLSFEFQRADYFGLIGRLDYYGAHVTETMAGSRNLRQYVNCKLW